MKNENKRLLTVTVKMLAPKDDVIEPLAYRPGEILQTISVAQDIHQKMIEVYRYDLAIEWRIVEIAVNLLGVRVKTVRYDSYESKYANTESALRDALLFHSLQ